MLRHTRAFVLSTMVLTVSAFAHKAEAQGSILFRLHTNASGDRLLADTSGGLAVFGKRVASCSVIPATGAGTRMMWFPCQGAFRAGEVNAAAPTAWNLDKVGYYSLATGKNNEASGDGSVALGQDNVTSGTNAVAVGHGHVVTGDNGFAAGVNAQCAGAGCIALGSSASALGLVSVAIGSHATASGERSMALGTLANTNNQLGSFVWSDVGLAGTLSQTDNEFRVRAKGGIALRTAGDGNSAPGVNGNTGCDLAAGSGSWSCASSRYVKENFSDVDGEGVLAKISAMPVTTWNYITEDRAVRHMGPVAQDFYAAFALGTDSASIGMIDINGVNLAAVKALEQRTADLKAAQEQLADKAKRIDVLEERVARLEQALAKRSR